MAPVEHLLTRLRLRPCSALFGVQVSLAQAEPKKENINSHEFFARCFWWFRSSCVFVFDWRSFWDSWAIQTLAILFVWIFFGTGRGKCHQKIRPFSSRRNRTTKSYSGCRIKPKNWRLFMLWQMATLKVRGRRFVDYSLMFLLNQSLDWLIYCVIFVFVFTIDWLIDWLICFFCVQ